MNNNNDNNNSNNNNNNNNNNFHEYLKFCYALKREINLEFGKLYSKTYNSEW